MDKSDRYKQRNQQINVLSLGHRYPRIQWDDVLRVLLCGREYVYEACSDCGPMRMVWQAVVKYRFDSGLNDGYYLLSPTHQHSE